MKKKKINRKKITIFLLTAVIVVLFLIFTLKSFEEEVTDINNIMGERVTNVQLSVNDFVKLCENTIGIYISAATSGDYKKTYSLLNSEYRAVIDFDTHKQEMEKLDFTDAYIKSIDPLTTNIYNAQIVYSDDTSQNYLILLKDKNFSIVPEFFIAYREVEECISRKKVEYYLESYEVYLNVCVFNMTITNNRNEEVLISQASMLTSDGFNKEENIDIVIQPNETKKISIEIPCEIDVPEQFSITRETDKKYMNYAFEL